MPVVADKKVVLFCFRNTIVKEWDSFPGYQAMNRQHTDCGKRQSLKQSSQTVLSAEYQTPMGCSKASSGRRDKAGLDQIRCSDTN